MANGRQLAADARLLLKSGSSAVARSLAILSMEETGKALIAKRAAEAEDEERAELEQLLKSALIKHGPKLEQIQQMFDLMTSLVRLLMAFTLKSDEELNDGWSAQALNLAKQDGFYVGLAEGVVRSPSEVTAADAEPLLMRADVAIEAVASLVGSVFIVEGG